MPRASAIILLLAVVAGCTQPIRRVTEAPPRTHVPARPKPPASTPEPAPQYPQLAGTTWEGETFEGEKCQITFSAAGHAGPGFTFTSPSRTVTGAGWFFMGAPDYNGRSGQTSYPVGLEFITNYARYRGTIIEDSLVFDEVVPRVVAIDYKMLLGDAYKGQQSIIEQIDCAGQTIGAFVVFDIDHNYARKNLEHTISSELDERERVKPGPYGLGEATYYKWVDFPKSVPELYFIRWNLYVAFPAHYVFVKSPEVRNQLFEIAYIIDSAVRFEHPSVTVIHMPKVLRKKGT